MGPRERRRNGWRVSAAASVGLAAVVRLRAASAQLASFCLCHSRARVPTGAPYRRVDLTTGGWSLCDVAIAGTHRERRRGLRGASSGALLIRARSIHTFGCPSGIDVVELDRTGVVEQVRSVGPRSVVVTGSAMVLEIVGGGATPEVGSRLRGMPSSAHERDPRDLCNPDRQSR